MYIISKKMIFEHASCKTKSVQRLKQVAAYKNIQYHIKNNEVINHAGTLAFCQGHLGF